MIRRYVKTGGGFTEALVRGAGHLVPMDKPAQTLQLISYFIRGLDMPLPSNYKPSDVDTPPYQDFVSNQIETEASGTKIAMTISIIINVLLMIGILLGIVYGLRWKHRVDMFNYNNVEANSVRGSVMALS